MHELARTHHRRADEGHVGDVRLLHLCAARRGGILNHHDIVVVRQGIVAGGSYAVRRGGASQDQRIDITLLQHLMQPGAEKRRKARLHDDRLAQRGLKGCRRIQAVRKVAGTTERPATRPPQVMPHRLDVRPISGILAPHMKDAHAGSTRRSEHGGAGVNRSGCTRDAQRRGRIDEPHLHVNHQKGAPLGTPFQIA